MPPSRPDPTPPPDPSPGEQPPSGLDEYVRGVALGTVLGRMMMPFAFTRDASGFAMPEFRLDKAALQYLSSLPWQGSPAKGSSLDELLKRFDRPVDLALVSWTSPPPLFPLAIDPARPAEPLPAAYVDMLR